MTDLIATLLLNGHSFTDLILYPNILLGDRPEVFVFKSKKHAFVVESGSGGFLGHAHSLQQVKSVPKKIKGALVYFTIDSEYLHSHPDSDAIYYIGKTKQGQYKIFSPDGVAVERTSFDGLHYHSLLLREVIPISK